MGILRFLLIFGAVAQGIRADKIPLNGWPQGQSSLAKRDAFPSSESIKTTAVDPTEQKNLVERQMASTCGAEPMLSCSSSASVATTKGSLSFTIYPAPVSGPRTMSDSAVASTTNTEIRTLVSAIETTQTPTSMSTAFSTSTVVHSAVMITNSPIPISLPRGSTESSLTPSSSTALSSVTSTSSLQPPLPPQILETSTPTDSSTLAPFITTSFATQVLTASTTFSPVIAANPAAPSSPKLSSGAQIGIGVGAGLVAVAVGLVLYKQKKRRAKKDFKPKEQNDRENWSPFETRADNRSDLLFFDGKERSRVVEKATELGMHGREIVEME